MEIELKLSLAAADIDKLRSHPLLATAVPHTLSMSDTYFDTPAQHLRRHRAGLRVRRTGDSWTQTMKAGGSVEGGLHRRHEWETAIAGPMPDLSALSQEIGPHGPWSKLLRNRAVTDSLEPLFTTTIERQLWNVRLPQGDLVECALDLGHVRSGERQTGICELELELKAGEAAHLFDFALALQHDIPFRIGTLNKAERGYALYMARSPGAVKASALTLNKRMRIEQAFQNVAANCMMHMQANEAGVTESGDIESLHQMRVGLRRLRAALRLFAPVITLPEPLQQDLDWLAGQLGPARDWDVFTGSTLPGLASALPDDLSIGPLLQAAQAQSERHHATAAEVVGSARYTRLVLLFTRWMLAMGWREQMAPEDGDRLAAPIGGYARRMLLKDQHRLLQRGRHLDGASAAERHRVRIAAKRARYTSEFFASLLPPRRLPRYVRALTALQDILGTLNDARVADRLLADIGAEQAQQESAATYLRGYLAARGAASERPLRKAWRRFKRSKLAA